MTKDADPNGNVVRLETRPPLRPPTTSPVADLSAYSDNQPEPDDYRHRMKVNAAAMVVVVLLVAAGLWIADTMAQLRKDQECVLSGRRACSPVAVVPGPRY